MSFVSLTSDFHILVCEIYEFILRKIDLKMVSFYLNGYSLTKNFIVL